MDIGKSGVGWKEFPAHSFDEFIEAVHGWPGVDAANDEFWFRGQSNETWPLETSLSRSSRNLNLTEDQLSDLESVALKAFRWAAHLHVKPELLAKLRTIPCWWALMQHHGAPTRLLDWSLSPYVAAYFAVLQDRDGAPGVVWAFCSSQLREAFKKGNNGKPIRAFEAKNARTWYRRRIKKTLKGQQIVIPLSFSLASSERIVAQQGKFTMSFDINSTHNSIGSQIESRFSRKIVIPHHMKPEFLLRLRRMNITGASLFPGVDGLGMAMRELVSLGKFYDKAVCPTVLTSTMPASIISAELSGLVE
jgi:hypothetical protein